MGRLGKGEWHGVHPSYKLWWGGWGKGNGMGFPDGEVGGRGMAWGSSRLQAWWGGWGKGNSMEFIQVASPDGEVGGRGMPWSSSKLQAWWGGWGKGNGMEFIQVASPDEEVGERGMAWSSSRLQALMGRFGEGECHGIHPGCKPWWGGWGRGNGMEFIQVASPDGEVGGRGMAWSSSRLQALMGRLGEGEWHGSRY